MSGIIETGVPCAAGLPDVERDAALEVHAERYLREVRHETGNRFHKLFFRLESLQAEATGEAAEELQAVHDGVVELEATIRGLLAFFRPMNVKPITLAAADVLAALKAGFVLCGVEVGEEFDGPVDVLADPGLLSDVCSRVAAMVHASTPEGAEVRLGAAPSQPPGFVAFRIGGPGPEAGAEADSGTRLLETTDGALAARMVFAQSGELIEMPGGGLELRLPAASPEETDL